MSDNSTNTNAHTNNPASSSEITPQQYREDLFNNAEHSERIFLAYKAVQPIFAEAINRILDGYNLATRLQEAIQKGHKLRVLELNCAEGLFLHELARILEERSLLAGVELFGISGEVSQINTAEGYSRLSTPPRPYLNFYLHDIHQPLEDCLGLHEDLKASAPATFDLIFGANGTLETTKDAKEIVERLYRDNLKADGFMLFNELILAESGPDGWEAPHPAIGELLRVGLIPLASYNPGVGEVALAVKEWLVSLGIVEPADLQQYKVKMPHGGYSEQGRNLLRSTILLLGITGPQFVSIGLLSQARFEELWATIRREIAPQHEGYTHYVITIGHKPK
jgi:hypothetical protein